MAKVTYEEFGGRPNALVVRPSLKERIFGEPIVIFDDAIIILKKCLKREKENVKKEVKQ